MAEDPLHPAPSHVRHCVRSVKVAAIAGIFLLIIGGNFRHFLNKQFLPKTRYIVNNDSSCSTALNNVTPLSSFRGAAAPQGLP